MYANMIPDYKQINIVIAITFICALPSFGKLTSSPTDLTLYRGRSLKTQFCEFSADNSIYEMAEEIQSWSQ